MLDFPKSTVFGRRISKEKFYSHLEVGSALRSLFIDDVDSIIWRNKLSASTLNVAAGQAVVEIDVLELFMKKLEYDERLLQFMDQNLPHHILFVIRVGNRARIVINYKERAEGGSRFKIGATCRTDWTEYEHLSLTIDGLNLDKVYENFILQAADGEWQPQKNETLGETIEKAKERKKLEGRIEALKEKIKKEKQFNVQVELNQELRRLKEQLDILGDQQNGN